MAELRHRLRRVSHPARPRRRKPGRADVRAPETLHPMLWLGHQLGRQGADAVPSGFAALDAELPGGGWPRRVLSELLLPHPGVGEIRLLAPPLVATQRAGRLVMLFDPPAALSAAALAAARLRRRAAARRQHPGPRDPGQRQPVGARAGAEERPRRRGARLAAAAPAHRAPAPPAARCARHDGAGLRDARDGRRGAARPRRRCAWRCGPAAPTGCALRILKRRGPPLETPLQLALPPVLSEAARRRAQSALHEPAPGLREATFVNLA